MAITPQVSNTPLERITCTISPILNDGGSGVDGGVGGIRAAVAEVDVVHGWFGAAAGGGGGGTLDEPVG